MEPLPPPTYDLTPLKDAGLTIPPAPRGDEVGGWTSYVHDSFYLSDSDLTSHWKWIRFWASVVENDRKRNPAKDHEDLYIAARDWIRTVMEHRGLETNT